MPIQCAEGQTPTPAKLAASHTAADELRHRLLNFRSRTATGTTTFFYNHRAAYNSWLSPKTAGSFEIRSPNHKCASAMRWSMTEPLPTVPAGLALNLPHTSLFIQAPQRLERKIVEMLRSSMSRRAES
jgi:hypothetical protein